MFDFEGRGVGAKVISRSNYRTRSLLSAGLLSCAFGGSPAEAQTTPPPPPSASQVTPRNVAPEGRAGEAPAIDVQRVPGEAPPGAEKLTFTPTRVALEGGKSELQPEERRLLGPLSGRQITVTELYAAAAELEAAYARRGYILARIVVPPQALEDGKPARLVLVNGFIESIDVSGVARRIRGPVTRALQPLLNDTGVTLVDFERRLAIAGDVPGADLRSTLVRGDAPGGVKLVIAASSDPASGSLSFDNRVGGAFGDWQFNAQLALNSLLGQGEQFYSFVSGDPAEGFDAFDGSAPRRVGAVGMFVPLNADGLRLNIEGTRSITQPAGGFFRTRGSFSKVAGRLSYPLIRSRRKNLYLGAALERLLERQTAPEFGVGLYRDQYTIGRLSADYDTRWGRSAAALSATFSGGHGAEPISLPLSRAGATENYAKAEMRGSYSAALPQGFALEAVARGQKVLSGGLPSSEIFALDGPEALSPFESGRLSADEGATLRLAVAKPIPLAKGRMILSPSVYAAAGIAGFKVSTPFDVTRAGAVGVALNVDFQPVLLGIAPSVSLDWGRQFTNGIIPDRSRLTAVLTARF